MNKMYRKSILYFLIAFTVLFAGCSSLTDDGQKNSANPTVTPASQSEVNQTPAPDSSLAQTLKIWIPEEFDPSLDNPAGLIFQNHLSDFTSLHPNVRIEVRLKTSSGSGGLLDSITSAAAAAPLALPDLVLLSRTDLEMAAKTNILHPLDNLLNDPEDRDWYDFAAHLAQVESQTYGLPFAGDALLMVYDNEIISQPPSSWAETITVNTVLAFPSSDPTALFTIALYQSLGGELLNEDGDPNLSAQQLSSVFNFYTESLDSGIFPVWLTQHETYETAWESFRANQSNLVVTWSSLFFSSSLENYSAAPIPTQDANPFTLATGWAWALTSPIASRHSLSVELAEFLSESNFLSEWTFASGFLPPRPTSLAGWPQGSRQAIASQIIPSAQLIPDTESLHTVGLILSDLVIRILKGEIDVSAAVESALESVSQS
jgi:maltose-binding protein MalE